MICCRFRADSLAREPSRDQDHEIMSATNGIDQFLVAPRNAASAGDLAAFEQAMQSVPGAAILQRAGKAGQPRLVVALPAASASHLREQFGATLIIEPNAPLQPF
jgi:hypothetical protein